VITNRLAIDCTKNREEKQIEIDAQSHEQQDDNEEEEQEESLDCPVCGVSTDPVQPAWVTCCLRELCVRPAFVECVENTIAPSLHQRCYKKID
jgi:hypothetical protein